MSEEFIYDGFKWSSLFECCRFYGTTESTINKYSHKFKLSIPEALDLRRVELSWDNYKLEEANMNKEAKKLANHYNLNYNRIVKIMKETGMGIEGAIEEEMNNNELPSFIIKGNLYDSIPEACSDLSIDPKVIYEFSKEQGLDPTEGLSLYVYLNDIYN